MSQTYGKITFVYDFEHDLVTITVPLDSTLDIDIEELENLLDIAIGLSNGHIKRPEYFKAFKNALKNCGVIGGYSMKLWECRYTLECSLWTDEYVDYFYSTKIFTAAKMQKNWDKIHPGYYTVSKFKAVEVKSELGPLGETRHNIAAKIPSSAVVTRCYKDRGG